MLQLSGGRAVPSKSSEGSNSSRSAKQSAMFAFSAETSKILRTSECPHARCTARTGYSIRSWQRNQLGDFLGGVNPRVTVAFRAVIFHAHVWRV
jgi:hypothetical protein